MSIEINPLSIERAKGIRAKLSNLSYVFNEKKDLELLNYLSQKKASNGELPDYEIVLLEKLEKNQKAHADLPSLEDQIWYLAFQAYRKEQLDKAVKNRENINPADYGLDIDANSIGTNLPALPNYWGEGNTIVPLSSEQVATGFNPLTPILSNDHNFMLQILSIMYQQLQHAGVPYHNPAIAYPAGTLVSNLGTLYVSKIAIGAGTPITNSAWQLFGALRSNINALASSFIMGSIGTMTTPRTAVTSPLSTSPTNPTSILVPTGATMFSMTFSFSRSGAINPVDAAWQAMSLKISPSSLTASGTNYYKIWSMGDANVFLRYNQTIPTSMEFYWTFSGTIGLTRLEYNFENLKGVGSLI